MIRQLQRKFIAITMLSLLLVMALVLGAINAANVYHMNERADGILDMLAENDGAFPGQRKDVQEPGGELHGGSRPEQAQTAGPGGLAEEARVAASSGGLDAETRTAVSPGGIGAAADSPREAGSPRPERGMKPGGMFSVETPFETRYFIVRTDLRQSITAVDTGHIAAITDAEARQYASHVLEGGRERGYTDKYRYRIVEQEEGSLVIFVDCRNQVDTVLSFLRNSCAIALASMLIVFLLISILSKRVIRPVIESMEKQKQFITDAGHEIKTPLAIISANNDVIEMTCGRSEWTASIHNQVMRLSELVKNLLTLAKMDEGAVEMTFSNVSLSDLVSETVWSFEALAKKKNLTLDLQVQSGIEINGDEAALAHLVAILTDNAVKYADPSGHISVTLAKRGKTSCLEISNTCASLTDSDLSKLFGRFYRADGSRSRESGGYGIGLSVAQAIVKAHGGRISARKRTEDRISFTVEISRPVGAFSHRPEGRS